MIQDAQVHLAGYVAAEPKFKKVSGDISSVKLRVAYTARRRDKETGEWTDGPTSFVTIQCWRALAENVHMSVHKGEPVLVTGRLQIRRFEDLEGAPRTVAEIEARISDTPSNTDRWQAAHESFCRGVVAGLPRSER